MKGDSGYLEELHRISSNYSSLERLVVGYEFKASQYLQRDLRIGKGYSIYTPCQRRERFMSVVRYANKRGFLEKVL